MRNRRIVTAAVAAAVLPVLLPALPAAASLGPAWTRGPDFPSPPGSTGADWQDVSASGPADVWAVGAVRGGATDAPLTAHWDGNAWTAVPPPKSAAAQRYSLAAVDAVATRDVWAVGSAAPNGTRTGLIMHYDGAWAATTLPEPGIGQTGELSDVDGSAAEGWAVGRVSRGPGTKALLVHRLGGTWTQVPPPGTDSPVSELSAVHVRTADDVWAAGSQVRVDGVRAPLILHWDGAEWQEQALPQIGVNGEAIYLASVAASTPDDVWAAGRRCRTDNTTELCRPVALHLSEGVWSVPPTTGGETELTEVLALSPTDVWVVGYAAGVIEGDYAEHWDGRVFTPDTVVASPSGGHATDGELASALSAATTIPGTGAVWAVGWARDPVRGGTHVVHRG